MASRFVGLNYLDANPKMAMPPAYWLQRLYDFDAELVVFPSFYIPYSYVLARRRRHGGMVDRALAETITQPDTRFCLSHGLVPVTMITRERQTGGWDIDPLIRSLKARDIWAHGGGEAMADQVDAADEREEVIRKQDLRNDMDARAALGYAIYKRRTGQRVTSPGMGSERHTPTTGSSGSTASASSVTLA